MSDFDRIAAVIRYLDQHHTEQPELARLATEVGLSSFHFHRLFSRWAGITPKAFLQCLTLQHAKAALRNGTSVLQTALDTGLSGPGRLHDLCVKLSAASPGEIKTGGAGWTIHAGFASSPLGTCLVAECPRGICHFSFVETRNRRREGAAIQRDWPAANVEWDYDAASLVTDVFAVPADPRPAPELRVFLRGTKFQVHVWKALLSVPPGALTSYGQLGEVLGDRTAARAVGSAVAKNRLAYLVPCHRVIRETGVIGDYQWGATRKRALVAWEHATRMEAVDSVRIGP